MADQTVNEPVANASASSAINAAAAQSAPAQSPAASAPSTTANAPAPEAAAQTDVNAQPEQAQAAAPETMANPFAGDQAQGETKPETESEPSEKQVQQAVDQTSDDVIPDGEYSFLGEALQKDGLQLEDGGKGIQEFFKGSKLTNKQARTMYGEYIKGLKEVAEGYRQASEKAFKERTQNWINEIQADKEIGGDNFAKTRLNIGRAMEQFGTPELKKFLNETQDGYNPELVRFVARVGAALGNDGFVGGNGTMSKEDQVARDKRLYPKSPDLWGR